MQKWTTEKLFISAKKYSILKEWRLKEPSAYTIAAVKGILKECTKHMSKGKENWNKEKIISSAKKFKTRKDWNLNDPKAYGAARRLNLVDEATKHMERLGNRFLRCIYALEVKNKKQIYIGLTYNYTRRIRDHLKSKRFLLVIKKYGKQSIIHHQITEYIPKDLAVEKEVSLINYYTKKGYYLLNIAKGGSLGSPVIKWTKEKIINEAKKYNTVVEWIKYGKNSYAAAAANNLLSEASKDMARQLAPIGFYSRQKVIEIATQYKSFKEWYEKDRKSYSAAHRLNLLNDDFLLKKLIKITGKPITKWDKKSVIENAKLFNLKSEWKRNYAQAYKSSRKNGWFDEATQHMLSTEEANKLAKEKTIKWNKNTILKDAKKYSYRSEWKRSSGSAYSACLKLNLLSEATAHMQILNNKGKWNKKTILVDAKKYLSKSTWNKNSSGAYEAAKKIGIFDEAVKHMVKPDMKQKWTKDNVHKEAKKYKFKSDFNDKAVGAYGAAKKNGWFDEVTAHMQNKKAMPI